MVCKVGTVTILVNNAGIVSGSALLDTPDGRSVFFIAKVKLDKIELIHPMVGQYFSNWGNSKRKILILYCSKKINKPT